MIAFALIKMLMNADFGDNSIQLIISLFVIAIAYFAWRTTNIRVHPHYHTVLLLERRLRRRPHRSRLTTHIQSTSIVAGVPSEVAGGTTSENLSIDNTQTAEASKPPEANTSNSPEDTNNQNLDNISTNTTLEERELGTIVEIMDADTNEVRRRRLAYYENRRQGEPVDRAQTSSEPVTSTTVRETVSRNVDTTRNEPIMEHNYAEREMLDGDTVNVEEKQHKCEEKVSSTSSDDIPNSIRIKLKYLNDDLKMVDGRLEEQLGEFKRRHFHLEFSTNKLVRLIFNGKVLQPDTDTLQSCGLFDNCVVHCLIHQPRNVSSDNSSGPNAQSNNSSTQGINNNNNQGRDWDLGNILFALVSLILTSAWYFRYEYAHLYNVTATIALVVITGIFTIFLVGVYFPDYEQPRIPRQ